MAGFNAITSPLTLANTQATYSAMKSPTVTTSSPSTSTTTKTTTPTNTNTPTTSHTYNTTSHYNAAAAAAAKAAAQAQADYNSAKGVAYSSINDAIGDTGNKLNSSVLDYLGNLRTSQKAIDKAAVQNEMSRESGRLGVMDMVGRGIQSGGVILNNKGATNSSAGEALAKAYGDIGRRQLTSVGNQYELGNQDIAEQQSALNDETATYQRHYGEQKQSAVNSIVQDASTKLAALNAAAQNASLSDRIDIEQQKAAIRNQALNQLASYDTVLSQGIGSVTAATTDQNRAAAKAALLAGTAPADAFNYTTSAPAEFQNTGPYSSPLQVFTKKDDDSLVPVGA